MNACVFLRWCSMTLLYDFNDFFDFIVFINCSFNSSSCCLLVHSFSVFVATTPLTIILIVIGILYEPITVFLVINTFNLSSKALRYSVTPLAFIFEVIIILKSIVITVITLCHKAIYVAIFILGPRTKIWRTKICIKLYVSNSSQFILMPFSDMLKKLIHQYPDSLSLT